jgi:hypothetical protein
MVVRTVFTLAKIKAKLYAWLSLIVTWGKIKAKLYAWLFLVFTWGKIKAKLYAWLSLQSLPEVKLKLSCMYGYP